MKILENIRTKYSSPVVDPLSNDEVAGLENSLQMVLTPVSPRPEFVERLNKQIITTAALTRNQFTIRKSSESKTRDNLLIGAASLLGAAAIFATGFRVIITVIGAIGILVQMAKRRTQEKPPTFQHSH